MACTQCQTFAEEFIHHPFLPPARVVRGNVMFILGNVCLSKWGKGYPPWPGLRGGVPTLVWPGGYLSSSQQCRYLPWLGLRHLPWPDWRVAALACPGVYTFQLMGVPTFQLTGGAYLPADRGTYLTQGRYPPPSPSKIGTPLSKVRVLAMRRAVCLLRSHKRSFYFTM